jgi:hypothetical protein
VTRLTRALDRASDGLITRAELDVRCGRCHGPLISRRYVIRYNPNTGHPTALHRRCIRPIRRTRAGDVLLYGLALAGTGALFAALILLQVP